MSVRKLKGEELLSVLRRQDPTKMLETIIKMIYDSKAHAEKFDKAMRECLRRGIATVASGETISTGLTTPPSFYFVEAIDLDATTNTLVISGSLSGNDIVVYHSAPGSIKVAWVAEKLLPTITEFFFE